MPRPGVITTAIPLDLTEAYLQFRPYPRDGFRLRLKAGAFYAPISLENRASGWDSPYTLSYSAINTWLGKELRHDRSGRAARLARHAHGARIRSRPA